MKHPTWLRATLTVAMATMLPGSAAAAPSDVPEPEHSGDVDPAPVVGGQPVPEGKWRDAAAVMFGSDPLRETGCTGVLVAPDVVLTAGHCVGNSPPEHVMLDANDLRDQGEILAVQRGLSYPSWYDSYDLGVLVLEQPAQVEPRTIATGCIRDRYTKDGGEVAIVGYGATDPEASEYGSELREAFTTIADADCSNLDKGCEPNVSPGGELGAGGDGIDSCNGDSGGPLYLLTDRGDYLVGITSRAYSDATQPCSQGGIYVRPDAVVEWIEGETGRDLPDAVCNLAPDPRAELIEVRAGAVGTTQVTPNDPDQDSGHTYDIAVAAEHGEVIVYDDGTVEYVARDDYEGADSFTIEVTDTGDPALSGQVLVQVTVLPAEGCGCRSGVPGSGGALLLALVALALARPRRHAVRIRRRHR